MDGLYPPLHTNQNQNRALSLAEANAGSAPVVMLTLRLLTNLAKHMGARYVFIYVY